LEEALFLTKFASSVALIVPTSSFKAGDALVKEIEHAPNVTIHFSARLTSILGDLGVTGIRIAPRQGPEVDLPVEGAFIYLQGSRPITDYLLGQLETTPKGCLKVDDHMQTSAPVVFAIGDLLCTHVKQAVIAAADGVVAAIEVEKHLNHRAKAKIDWG
jgi:thioredoxin reductase (NADPH)